MGTGTARWVEWWALGGLGMNHDQQDCCHPLCTDTGVAMRVVTGTTVVWTWLCHRHSLWVQLATADEGTVALTRELTEGWGHA